MYLLARCWLKRSYLCLIRIILTVLCKVFETALFGNLKFIATCLYGNIASSRYPQARKLRKLQNQNVLLYRLAKEYEILPVGENLSVEIVREFLTAGRFLENSASCWPRHLNTTKSEKS